MHTEKKSNGYTGLLKFIAITLASLLLYSCHNPVVKKYSKISHHYTVVYLKNDAGRYKASEQVGGEQINSTILLADAGKTYLLAVASDSESLTMHLDGADFEVEHDKDKKYTKRIHCLETTQIEISLTSYPDASSYDLSISQEN
jgi:hypothetical protein